MSALALPEAELAGLERAVALALETGTTTGLEILGFGEVSCVVGLSSGGRRLACKRLPPFHDRADFAAYESSFHEYLQALESKGVRPVESVLQTLERADGGLSAWCVQPRLDAEGLVSKRFHSCSEPEARTLFVEILGRILGSVGPTLGLDGQLSNWILDGTELRYLDVTTPMLRTERGAERMPVAVFLASLPWALRPAVRRFVLRDIMNKYYEPRGVVLDLLGNLYKEKLTGLLPAFLELASSHVLPPITAQEAERYYDADARSWALLQRLRRADRWWQTRVRRRVYPFLLPGEIER